MLFYESDGLLWPSYYGRVASRYAKYGKAHSERNLYLAPES